MLTIIRLIGQKFKNYSRIEGNTQNIIQSEINFKHKRQLFKNICSKKMRDNLYNEDDPGLITKNSDPMLSQTLSLVDCLKLCI